MQIFILKESIGRWDNHRVVDVKGFLVEADAHTLRVKLEAERAEEQKTMNLVSEKFEKWLEVNPRPEYKPPHSPPHSYVVDGSPEGAANDKAYFEYMADCEEWYARWYKSYVAYSKLFNFKPADVLDADRVMGRDADHYSHQGFHVATLEVV